MRVLLVRAAGNCGQVCGAWISAEGRIAPETVAEFAKVLKVVGKRKLPVFVHSPGGNIIASLAIGRLLRAHQLDVSVTRTQFQPCSGDCGSIGYLGVPTSSGAVCASACAYLIAGGVRRFVSPGSQVGVHDGSLPPIVVQFTMTMIDAKGKEVELGHKNVVVPVSEILKSSEKLQKKASLNNEILHQKIAQYNREMGITDAIVTLAFSTKPPDIHWMTRPELSVSRLMTNGDGGEQIVGISPAASIAPADFGSTRDERSK